MTNSDLMILAYPIIGAVAMAIASVGALIFMGYHKPVRRQTENSTPHETINRERLVERVLLSLSDAELDYVAERSAALAARSKARREATHA